VGASGVCDFLLVIRLRFNFLILALYKFTYLLTYLLINSNFGPVLHIFPDTATYWLKIAIFFIPHYHLTPSLRVKPVEFPDELFIAKNSPCAIRR